jgi:hypothetical protein
MLLEEIVPVCCESRKKHNYTDCGQNAEFCYVKAGGA